MSATWYFLVAEPNASFVNTSGIAGIQFRFRERTVGTQHHASIESCLRANGLVSGVRPSVDDMNAWMAQLKLL
jgi:hypothetical protein